MWIRIAIAIELTAAVGAIGIAVTKRTLVAFVSGFNTMALVTGIFLAHTGISFRGLLVVTMVAVYLLRMNWVLLFWSDQTAASKLDDKTPTGQKLLLPFVLSNTVGWAYCLPIYFALQRVGALCLADAVAVGIYVLGTVLHFGSDYQKRRFKLRSDAKGKLLDTGFWALCRHPNYLGDFLIYVSFAVSGANLWGWVGPACNLLQYCFDAIPKNEKWAKQRYGPAWDAYKKRTKTFIPHLL
jgi:steroid 5-alpha reductase family enzyme